MSDLSSWREASPPTRQPTEQSRSLPLRGVPMVGALAVGAVASAPTTPPLASPPAPRIVPLLTPAATRGEGAAALPGAERPGEETVPFSLPSAGKGARGLGELPALEAVAITKSLPLGRERVEILKGISLRIAPGELVAIMGPSGSGKSTLLGIIAGLDSPTEGKVFVDGVDITHKSEGQLASVRNAKIGMVYQAFNLIPNLTARENVEVPLYVGHHPGRPSERARELLELVGLGHRLGNRPSQLSGGEQQRVAIARALATDPAIVIMDEPTGNLDQANSEHMLQMVRDLRERTGKTFIIATHDPKVAAAADRAIRIVDGQIADDTEPTPASVNEGADKAP